MPAASKIPEQKGSVNCEERFHLIFYHCFWSSSPSFSLGRCQHNGRWQEDKVNPPKRNSKGKQFQKQRKNVLCNHHKTIFNTKLP